MRRVNVYSLEGKALREIELPKVFGTEFRPDLIQRAVVALQANRRQPYGSYRWAGMETSADYFGRRRGSYRQTINRGISRLPREKLPKGALGRVRRVPQAVGGRRAHPPKPEKDFSKRVNKKEMLLALKSAISATAIRELVERRGHELKEGLDLPLVIEDKLEELQRTKEVIEALRKLGLEEEFERCKEKKVRAGKGKVRGRRHRRKKGILVVVSKDKGIKRAARNIPGTDVTTLEELNVELLAPGSHAGRLTIWSESSLLKLDEFLEGERWSPTR